MKQSPNFEEPLKPNKDQHHQPSGKTAHKNNDKQPPKDRNQSKTGEPVLGSDKGPWKGTD